jgi:hypothetical protein
MTKERFATWLLLLSIVALGTRCSPSSNKEGGEDGGAPGGSSSGGGSIGAGSGSGGDGGSGSGSGGTTGPGSGHDGGSSSGGTEAGSNVPPSCPLVSGAVAAGGGAASASQTITLDGSGTGRTYDGLGAISGGGGNSALLMDYPEPQRSDILDYLFKPGYGASLQMFKVEIGGDANSTCGSESSHEHTRGAIQCNAGYEWWLMKEAKARNPNIALYSCAWGEPSWISGGFWSQDSITYHMDYLSCAKQNGLDIDYMGGWNESGYDASWFVQMASAMSAGGYKTKMACADETMSWAVADDINNNSALKSACGVIAVHYVCGGDGSSATTCDNNASAIATGLPLWQSESGSQDYQQGAPQWARTLNRQYIDGRMTATFHWPIVASNPKGLGEGAGNCTTVGLLVADTPWSGAYTVGSQLWVLAHTTQFTQPGTWQYVDDSGGYLGGDRNNGSYVTLRSKTGGDYTVVVETAVDGGGGPSGPQTVAFEVTGGLSTADVHVWATHLGSANATEQFVHGADVTPTGGKFWITLQPNHIYTISTSTQACKSTAQPPASGGAGSFALPHTESFEAPLQVGQKAPFFGDESGSFQVAPCTNGHTGQCYRQMAPSAPTLIFFNPGDTGTAFTLLGGDDWSDYAVSVDVLLESSGSADIVGRFSNWGGYWFSVSDTGSWQIVKNAGVLPNKPSVLASGTGAALGTNAWHTLGFRMKGGSLTGSVDGKDVGSANDTSYARGPAGLSVGIQGNTWGNVQFDNFSVTP